jgi:type IV secretory pathway TrbD component
MSKALYLKALNRQFYIMGIDRQLFFLLLGLCAPLAYSARFEWKMDIVAIVLFGLGYTVSIFITRADAQLLQIYKRHIKYRNYYASQPGIHARIQFIKPSVPVYQGNL